MFKYLRNIEGNSNPVMLMVKATATTANQPKAGDAVDIVSGLAQKAVAESTAILGIAKEDTVDGNVLVIVDPQATYRVPFTGVTKKTLAQADVFAGFDLKTADTIDLDVTAAKQFLVLEFDNTAGTAVVKINKPIM